MIRRPPRSTQGVSSAASDVYKRQLVATAGLLFNAFSSGVESWNAYFRLFDESKFVHVTSLDFCALSALAPLFLWNDAEKRGAGWALPLAAIPMLGPLIYLILRPRASKP